MTQVVNGTLGVHAVLRDDASGVTERLRLWLERGPSGYYLRDAATGEPVRWEDERIRVAGRGRVLSARCASRPVLRPGRRLALVPEPENEHDPNAVGDLEPGRSLQVGYVPRDVASELRGDEQAVSLWRSRAACAC